MDRRTGRRDTDGKEGLGWWLSVDVGRLYVIEWDETSW